MDKAKAIIAVLKAIMENTNGREDVVICEALADILDSHSWHVAKDVAALKDLALQHTDLVESE